MITTQQTQSFVSVLKTRWLFFRQYWRLSIHLVCKTAHFGVNNQWWSAHPSPIAWSCRQRLWGILTVIPIVRNYQSMLVRSQLGWIPEADCMALGLSDKRFAQPAGSTS